ncbi:hypothetical protein [uncultured Tenacibaculum sp.]|uniref:hypothetical protein n=1 Tax=uncultured Tenacibaculum sp. TaxID=174713 RepID=UPI00260FACAB|nr:hypothetical protein [uncultured Tenacibaculum sp.]
MISITQRNELEKIKPPKYREKVREFLIQNGHKFSLETIQKVYSGKRKNLIIARAIITVFNNHLKEQKSIDSELKNLIKQIKND